MKKISKFLVLIVVLIVANFAVGEAMVFFRKQNNEFGKSEFRFENYNFKSINDAKNRAEEARAALLTLHPLGSPVDSLLKTLKNAGAASNCKDEITYSDKEDMAIYYRCNIPSVSFFGYTFMTTDWMIIVLSDNSLIKDIKINNGYTGL